mgnify:CR=1 FL=1
MNVYLKGKLGVFWHTQGSGKSVAMIFFAQKVLRRLPDLDALIDSATQRALLDVERQLLERQKAMYRGELENLAMPLEEKSSEALDTASLKPIRGTPR